MSRDQHEFSFSWPDLIALSLILVFLGFALARIQNRVESIERKVDHIIDHSGFPPSPK